MLYFTFLAKEEKFAIDISYIQLIVPSIGIKLINHLPKNIRGILEFGKEIVTVIDFNELITGNRCQEKMHARIAVVHNGKEGLLKKKLGILGAFATDIIESKTPLPLNQEHGTFAYLKPVLLENSTLIQLIDIPLFFQAFQESIYEKPHAEGNDFKESFHAF